MINLDSIKSSLASYFGSSESPTSKITSDLNSFKESMSTQAGINSLLQTSADKAISSIAKTAASKETKSVIQNDGTFLKPDDSTGISFFGLNMSMAAIAVVVGAFFILRK